jgi:hypothetical protein
LRRFCVLTLILIICFAVVSIPEIEMVKADFFPFLSNPPPLIISIQAPTGGGRYTQNSVSLTFTVKVPQLRGYDLYYPHGDMQYVGYSLNGQSAMKYIPPVTSNNHQYSVTVKGLSEGWNKITVKASCEHLPIGSALVIFHVDSIPPEISVLSPQNNDDYGDYLNDILLTFTVSEQAEWMGYSLDGQTNVTISGNTTLSQLFYGLHNLIVYAEDKAGHFGISENIYFSIVEENPDFPNNEIPEFPSWIILPLFLVAILFGIIVRRKIRVI